MKIVLIVVAIFLAMALIGTCMGPVEEEQTEATPITSLPEAQERWEKEQPDRPGDPRAYAEIEATTDCTALREGWDRNIERTSLHLDQWEATKDRSRLFLADVTQSYSDAYEKRMHETGCYQY